jgi:hypothetical protein
VLSGLGRQENTSIFVSRGVGTVYIPIRHQRPPEVAVITMKARLVRRQLDESASFNAPASCHDPPYRFRIGEVFLD